MVQLGQNITRQNNHEWIQGSEMTRAAKQDIYNQEQAFRQSG